MKGNSNRKRKLLENYVKKKFKKEERMKLFEKLSHSNVNSDLFTSSKNIGNFGKKTKTRRDDAQEHIVSTRREQFHENSEIGNVISDVSVKDKNGLWNDVDERVKAENVHYRMEKEVSCISKEKEYVKDDATILEIIKIIDRQKNRNVYVNRDENIRTMRKLLPIINEEHHIMEKINESLVTIISGVTGSGKTTQIPQFLYEAGYSSRNNVLRSGNILITQPRRIAAISMCDRVNYELGFSKDPILRRKVSYAIKYETTVTADSQIIFVTDGVLMREICTDFMLSKYSVIVLDEIHERSINTDVLIPLISRVASYREKLFFEHYVDKYNRMKGQNQSDNHSFKLTEDQVDNFFTDNDILPPLRVVMMSATMDVNEFTRNPLVFGKSIYASYSCVHKNREEVPIINIPSRQYPVTIHFNRATPTDYIEEAYKKVVLIHRRLPPGNILVFVTGQKEVWKLIGKLKKRFSETSAGSVFVPNHDVEAVFDDESYMKFESEEDFLSSDDVSSDKEVEINDSEDQEAQFSENTFNYEGPLVVLPLYSTLPINEQMKIFHPEKYIKNYAKLREFENNTKSDDMERNECNLPRLCIVATNVAETSITIPDISYVVDTGKVKEKVYYNSNSEDVSKSESTHSIEKYIVRWTSKASSEQRSGRAGRIGPGHCYRLYSSSVYLDMFPDFQTPQILKVPIDSLVLLLKFLGIVNIYNFPFVTPIPHEQILSSELTLVMLGALSVQKKAENECDSEGYKNVTIISSIGRRMALLPIVPRLSRILVSTPNKNGISKFLIYIISGISVGNVFLNGPYDSELKGRKSILPPTDFIPSDFTRLLFAIVHFMNISAKSKLSCENSSVIRDEQMKFCNDYSISFKAMIEVTKCIKKLSVSLTKHFNITIADVDLDFPTKLIINNIHKFIIYGFVDKIGMANDEKNKQFATLMFRSESAMEDGEIKSIYNWFSLRRSKINTLEDSRLSVIDRNSCCHSRNTPDYNTNLFPPMISNYNTDGEIRHGLYKRCFILYEGLHEVKTNKSTKLVMKNCCFIKIQWLLGVLKQTCSFSSRIQPFSIDNEFSSISADAEMYSPIYREENIMVHLQPFYFECYKLPVLLMKVNNHNFKVIFDNYLGNMKKESKDRLYKDLFLWFAKFLLEGLVFEQIRVSEDERKFTPKHINLVGFLRLSKTLESNAIFTKNQLVEKWKSSRNFLLDEILHSVKSSKIGDIIRKNWTHIHTQCLSK